MSYVKSKSTINADPLILHKRLAGKSFDFLNDASAKKHYAFNAFNTAFGSFATTLSKTKAGP